MRPFSVQLIWALAAAVLCAGCHRQTTPPVATPPPVSATEPTEPGTPNTAAEPVILAEAGKPQFETSGTFAPDKVVAKLPAFAAKADLSNLANRESFGHLTAKHRALLAANGFLAMPAGDDTLEAVYLRNGAEGMPGLLTSDALLNAFDRLTDATRERLERGELPALLTAAVLSIIERSEAQAAVASPALAEAARRNTAAFAVAASLLGVPVRVDARAGRLAQDELALLRAGAKKRSAIFAADLDYAAYRPNRVDTRAARYDAACQWLGLAAWRADAETPLATRQLLLLLHLLGTPPDRPLRQVEALADTRRFLMGTAEPRLAHALRTAAAVYGPRRQLADYEPVDRLRELAGRLSQPLILLPAISRLDDRAAASLATGAPNGLPGGLVLFQALGESRAEALVGGGYHVSVKAPAYTEALARTRADLASVDPLRWESNLADGRLWASAPLDRPTGDGWPCWQQSAAWADKTLSTMLAVWSASRHRGRATVAVTQEPAKSAPGYVEPAPEVYARLAQLTQTLAIGLRGHGLASPETDRDTDRFGALCLFAKRVAESELRNESLAPADATRLAAVGGELAGIGALEGQLLRPTGVAPLAAAGSTKVWTAVGPVQVIYAVVPDRGKLYLARGALLSYHEFAAPTLDDDGWRALVIDGGAPGQPEWAASYVQPNPYGPKLPIANAAPFPPPALATAR